VDRPLLRGKGPGLGPYSRRFDFAERTLLNVLDRQARERSDHPWLVFDAHDRLTFAEARRRVDRVGHALRDVIGAGDKVALLLRNEPAFFPAFLGAMAAGGVAVPLNADARGPLLQTLIESCDARVLVVRADLLDRLMALEHLGAIELVVVVGDGEAAPALGRAEVVRWEAWLRDRADTPPAQRPSAWDTALIQFTSGTTGGSKGAVLSHHYLYLCASTMTDTQRRRPDDVLSTPLPLYHVAALHLVAHSALHAGCTAHLRSRFSASTFWQEIADDGATFAAILGPMAGILLKTVTDCPDHRLRTVFCVPLPPGHEEFEGRFGAKLLWQGYGMTEIYPIPMPAAEDLLADVPPDTIGHPMSLMEYGVVDEHGRMLGPGEVGEMVFRPLLPLAMIDGYHRAPETTLAAVRNLVFHTGDLGAYDADGCLHYRGRRQDRIRCRGENISAVDIESVALGHEGVAEAAAYGVPGEFGEDEVKLDVVPAGDLDLSGLHGWLCERLPGYMVPRYLEACPPLPRTASERVEKYKLRARPLDRAEVREFPPRH
jgi:crotonobetaine/carnitine-CoA ligase